LNRIDFSVIWHKKRNPKDFFNIAGGEELASFFVLFRNCQIANGRDV